MSSTPPEKEDEKILNKKKMDDYGFRMNNKNKTVILSGGREMPLLGLTTDFRPVQAEKKVKEAITLGYRHLDSAWIHQNEKEVGRAIQAKIRDETVKREELWITTKLWNCHHAKDTVIAALEGSLHDLQLEYVDLFVMHYPFAFKYKEGGTPFCENIPDDFDDVDYIETWEAMEECVKRGYAKSLGVANFNQDQISRLLKYSRIPPVTNHVEVHPYFQQNDLIRFCDRCNIQVVAYNPLGTPFEPRNKDSIEATIPGEVFSKIGAKHNREPHHVPLNWLLYVINVAVTIKCVSEKRMREIIFDSFNFLLDQDDLEQIKLQDSDRRIVDCKKYQQHRFYPFHVDQPQPPKSSNDWSCTIL